jgi:iron complex transport system ATP-binding protein
VQVVQLSGGHVQLERLDRAHARNLDPARSGNLNAVTAPSTPGVVIADASLRRGDTLLLSAVDLTLHPGERWALLGPNGAGKTTLLSLVGARTHPTTGSVEILGRRLGRVDIRELWPRIGHVEGTSHVVRYLTCHQAVLTGATGTLDLQQRWQPTAAHEQRARELEDLFAVRPLADRQLGSLSSGELRRVLLARALMPDPELLLLDEPAANLDLPAREQLVEALDDLAATHPRLLVVLVTHHLEELPASTTHALLMRRGRVVASGPVAETLRDEPLTACFDLPLRVQQDAGRWYARSVRSDGPRRATG